MSYDEDDFDYDLKLDADEFFPFDDGIMNSDNGIPEDTPPSLRRQLKNYSRNVIKSVGKFGVDIAGINLPSGKDYIDSVKEAGDTIKNAVQEKIEKIKESTKKFFKITDDSEGSAFETIKKYAKNLIKETAEDTKQRLKSGELYRTSDENMEITGFDFDSEFGDFGSASASSSEYRVEEGSLPSEPFGDDGVEAKVVKKVKMPRKTINAAKAYSKAIAATNLGSAKIIASTIKDANPSFLVGKGHQYLAGHIQQATIATLEQQDKIYAKNFSMKTIQHEETMAALSNIAKNVMSINTFIQQIEGKSASYTLEWQTKQHALNQEILSTLRDIKKTSIISSPDYIKAREMSESYREAQRLKKDAIFGENGGMNGEAYAKRVMENFNQELSMTSLGMVLGMAPMVGSMLEMGQDMGAKVKLDPLSALFRTVFQKGLLSKKTLANISYLDDLFSNFPLLLNSKFAEMERFGKSNFARTVGRIFGIKDDYDQQNFLGLSNPNAQTFWTMKSDRTLNEVIPHRLSEIVTALTGKSLSYYDYSTGTFKTFDALRENYKMNKEMSYEEGTLNKFNEEILKIARTKDTFKESGMDPLLLESYLKQINKNISESGMRFAPEHLETSSSYKNQLLSGLPKKEGEIVLNLLSQIWQENMSFRDQMTMSAAYMKSATRNRKWRKSFRDSIQSDGGTIAANFVQSEDQIEDLTRALEVDPSLQESSVLNPDTVAGKAKILNIRKRRLEIEKKINALKISLGMPLGDYSSKNLYETDADVESSKIAIAKGYTQSGFNIEAMTNGSVSDTLSNIFNLLSKGIIVFPNYDYSGYEGGIPDHLKEIYETQQRNREKAIREEEIKRNELKRRREETIQLEREMTDFNEINRSAYRASIGEILGVSSETFKTINPVNQAVARAVSGTETLLTKLVGNPDGKSGEGLFGKGMSYEEIKMKRQREEVLNSINYYLKEDGIIVKSMKKAGPIGVAAKLAYEKLLKSRQVVEESLNNVIYGNNIDPKTGIIKNDFDKDIAPVLESANKAFNAFYNEYILETGNTYDFSFKDEFDKFKEVFNSNESVAKMRKGVTDFKDQVKEEGILSAVSTVGQNVGNIVNENSEMFKDELNSRISSITGDIEKLAESDERIKKVYDAVKSGKDSFQSGISTMVGAANSIKEESSEIKNTFTQIDEGIKNGSISKEDGEELKKRIIQNLLKEKKGMMTSKISETSVFMRDNLSSLNQILPLLGKNGKSVIDSIKSIRESVSSGAISKEDGDKLIKELVKRNIKEMSSIVSSSVSNENKKESIDDILSSSSELESKDDEEMKKAIEGDKIAQAADKIGDAIKKAEENIDNEVDKLINKAKDSSIIEKIYSKANEAKIEEAIMHINNAIKIGSIDKEVGEELKKRVIQINSKGSAPASSVLYSFAHEIRNNIPLLKSKDKSIMMSREDKKKKRMKFFLKLAAKGVSTYFFYQLNPILGLASLVGFKRSARMIGKGISAGWKAFSGLSKSKAGIPIALLSIATGHPIIGASILARKAGSALVSKVGKNISAYKSAKIEDKEKESKLLEEISSVKDALSQGSIDEKTANELIERIKNKYSTQSETISVDEKDSKLSRIKNTVLDKVKNASSIISDKIPKMENVETNEEKDSKLSRIKNTVLDKVKNVIYPKKEFAFNNGIREGSLEDEIKDTEKEKEFDLKKRTTEAQEKIASSFEALLVGLGIKKSGELDENHRDENTFADLLRSLREKTEETATATAEAVSNAVSGGGGFLGPIGGILGTIFAGKAAGKVAKVAKGAKGLVGTAGKLLSKGAKATGNVAKAGAKIAKTAGSAAAAGAKGVTKLAGLAGKLGKFAGPIGIALSVADALYSGVSGWNKAEEIAGLEEGEEATTGQKIGAAGANILSSLTFGLVKSNKIYDFFDNKTNNNAKEQSKIYEKIAEKKKQIELISDAATARSIILNSTSTPELQRNPNAQLQYLTKEYEKLQKGTMSAQENLEEKRKQQEEETDKIKLAGTDKTYGKKLGKGEVSVSTSPGETSSTAAKMSSSNQISNIDVLNESLTNALEIQQKLLDEQNRHNNIAEKFFESVLKYLSGQESRDILRANNEKNNMMNVNATKEEDDDVRKHAWEFWKKEDINKEFNETGTNLAMSNMMSSVSSGY